MQDSKFNICSLCFVVPFRKCLVGFAVSRLEFAKVFEISDTPVIFFLSKVTRICPGIETRGAPRPWNTGTAPSRTRRGRPNRSAPLLIEVASQMRGKYSSAKTIEWLDFRHGFQENCSVNSRDPSLSNCAPISQTSGNRPRLVGRLVDAGRAAPAEDRQQGDADSSRLLRRASEIGPPQWIISQW